MSKSLYVLLLAQFLSAFADNAILFTVIAMVMQKGQSASWYVPALQSVFLIAFVSLAPWVGHFADQRPKSAVLFWGNVTKTLGAVLLFSQINPLIAYAVVGVGAAIYSPAKYGILPELAGHQQLLKANSWIEGATIAAILSGMLVGAKVADYSVSYALMGAIALFSASALMTLGLPKTNTHSAPSQQSKVLLFIRQMGFFFKDSRSRFAILGGALFWATAGTLRVILVAWAPVVLGAKNASDVAQLTLFIAVGIIVGSAIVPRLIPLEHLRRTRLAAYGIAGLIVALSFVEQQWQAQGLLMLVGILGGIFIVPINAVLQEQGQHSIGSGRAVALQGFFQNLAILVAVATYTYAASQAVNPVMALLTLGLLVFIATFFVAWHVRDFNDAN